MRSWQSVIMTLSIQIISDIHLEIVKKFTIIPKAPYLALLGDIGDPGTGRYSDFLREQARQFEKVFVLIGNHSCYGRTPAIASQLISEICKEDPEHLVLLDKTSYEINETHTILDKLQEILHVPRGPERLMFRSHAGSMQD